MSTCVDIGLVRADAIIPKELLHILCLLFFQAVYIFFEHTSVHAYSFGRGISPIVGVIT